MNIICVPRIVPLVLLSLVLWFAHVSPASAVEIERLSVAPDGSQLQGNSIVGSITPDGRYVMIMSEASNLVPNDTNAVPDTFVLDRVSGAYELINISSEGVWGNDQSELGDISDDGRYVVFVSSATNLVPNDTNGFDDVFIRDRVLGITERISIATDGTEPNDYASTYKDAVSADGRYVLFSSWANNLVPNDTNGTEDIFIRDRMLGTTERVSIAPDGSQSSGRSLGGIISPDGSEIIFYSESSNLAPGDTNGVGELFIRDMSSGAITRVNMAPDGSEGNGPATGGSLSADGRYVAFQSSASNLVPGDTNGATDIFVLDRMTGDIELQSVASDGTQAQGAAAASISPDGNFIAFTASNVAPYNISGTKRNLYVHSRITGETELITVTIDGGGVTVTDGTSLNPIFTADGEYIAFYSSSSRLVPNDTNHTYDIFGLVNPLFNHAPVLAEIGSHSVSEGELLEFTLSAIDQDNDTLTYSAANLPTGATFDPQTATFSWMPGFDQAGNYPDIEFTVTDDGSPMALDVELVTITVGDVNRAPVFNPVGSHEVLEGQLLSFVVGATDPDLDVIVLSATNTPSGAAFDAQTGLFSWTPTLSQSGVYVVTFVATDNGVPALAGTIDVVITVGDNPTPTEQAEELVDAIVAYTFPPAVENAYLANLKKVEKFIEEGKIQPAINQLNAFIAKVESDYQNGVITQAEHNDLLTLANALLAHLQ